VGLTLALLAHIAGTVIAAILIYFSAPFLAEVTGMEIEFCYIVLYAILAIWSLREAQKIEDGRHNKANELEDIFSQGDKE
jgi:TctA family transporter